MSKIDFEGLSSRLLTGSREFLTQWLPGGKMHGLEYCCGDLQGGKGSSLKINTRTGLWKDFATGEAGGDLIDLYAAIQGVNLGEAARMLSENIGHVPAVIQRPQVHVEPVSTITTPPPGTAPPDFTHYKHGTPTTVYSYGPFFIARYEPQDGKKQFIPWAWSAESQQWVNRQFPAPRPLFRATTLSDSKPVMIVEGEKAAQAAARFATPYSVVTWAGGAQAFSKTDFTPLYGLKILLWPDADEPGRAAMLEIAAALHPHCPEVKLLNVEGMPAGWDAADSGFGSYSEFIEWAKPCVEVFTPAPAPQLQTKTPEIIDPDEIPFPTDAEIEAMDAAESAPPEDPSGTLKQMQLMCCIPQTTQGALINNSDSALRVLEHFKPFQDMVWFDDFHNKIFTRRGLKPGQTSREWQDYDTLGFMLFLQRDIGLTKATKSHAEDAILMYARQACRRTNEPKDWMETLTWDGTPRLDHFLETYFWAQPTNFVRAVSKNFWISAIARVYRPGCKVDNMMIFEGAQGKMKSTALSTLFNPWFAEATESVTSKDFYLLIQGKLVIEIAELDAFSKAETNTIKKVVSQQIDRFRPPYGRAMADHPRTCVFVGSTNEDEYLKDPTGARRFWPLTIGEIDIEGLKRDREQLFAEAVTRFKAGESWWEVPKDEAIAQQAERTESDEWEQVVARWAIGKNEVTVSQVAKDALGILPADLNLMQQKRIGRVLKACCYLKHNVRRGGLQLKVWARQELHCESENIDAVQPQHEPQPLPML